MWSLCALAALSCGRRAPSAPAFDPALIEVADERQAVMTGAVGHGKWASDATYVLVEARNRADRDALVTLGGNLTAAGAGEGAGAAAGERWPLRRESLRIPAGGSRLFALVDEGQAARPAARGARVEVVGAVAVDTPPPVVVTDGHVYRDGDRADLNGTVVNTADRLGAAVVFFAFFDEAGAPLKRVSTVFRLAPKASRGAHWVGPPGSASGAMFIGEVTY